MNTFDPVAAVRNFFAKLPDNEGEQAAMRMFLYTSLGFIYVYSLPAAANLNFDLIYTVIGIYFLAAVNIFGTLLFNPKRSFVRRLAGLFIDVLIVSALMLMTNEYGIAFFGFYMWICQEYALQNGRSFLRWAQSASVVGLLFVLSVGEYWHTHLQIGIGLLFTLLYLPFLTSRLLDRERTAFVEAENANRAKSRFLATVSHEIRTPLNAIIGLTDLLKHSHMSAEQSDWIIRSLSSSAEVLLSLVNNVLDIARIEAGKITIERRRFFLSALLANFIDVLRNSADAKGLHLSFEIAVPELDALIGDADHLSQILINLVANGIKFTEEGSVLIRISEVSRSANKVTLLWEIIDTGIGIPAEALGSIFDSFAQVNDSANSRYGGTGLGTAIAKELVERMGGKIGVKSELRKGSTFWFTLEFGLPRREDDSALGRLSPEVSGTTKHNGQAPAHLSVLLVEDNLTNRIVATKILHLLGHTVCAVERGEAALVCLASAKFDIVLLDMEMPGLSGLDVLHRISRLDNNWRPPVFMLTANAISEARDECEAAGASAFLTKPITIRGLTQALSTVPERATKSTSTILESPADHLKLIEQLTLGDNDFSYIFELEDGWCSDCVETIQLLERAYQKCDNEKACYVLHNIEGGAREMGARHIAGICREFLQRSIAAEEVDLGSTIAALKNADKEMRSVFERLKLMVFVGATQPHVSETDRERLFPRAC